MVRFDKELALTKALLDLMNEEQACLVAADIDAVSDMIDRKAKLIQDISLASSDRYRLLKNFGFEPNERGMADWILTQEPRVKEEWQKFHQIITDAKEANRINGMLIGKHFNMNQQRLNVFVTANKDTTELYGRSGKSSYASHFKPSLRV